KITVNDFVMKAAVKAAVKVPRANASFDGDAFVQYADVDLGIAVAIEDGLLTPVIRAAQNKSLREISELVKDLASRARNKRMKPDEFQGGTFTVSNLGGMGIDNFSAVINPPQGFILAIGAISKTAVVDDGDQIVVGHRMSITMSCDHRVIDGALGADYLKELRHLLENPALLLVLTRCHVRRPRFWGPPTRPALPPSLSPRRPPARELTHPTPGRRAPT